MLYEVITELVDDDRHVQTLELKLPQQFGNRFRFRHDVRRTNDILENDQVAVLYQAEHVLRVNDPDDVVVV